MPRRMVVLVVRNLLTSSGKYTETSVGAEASVRQRSALAQVGSTAAHEKRSVFPRAVAEDTYWILLTSHFISTVKNEK